MIRLGKPPRLVSFLGRAGVGKSTLASALVDELSTPAVGLNSVWLQGGAPMSIMAFSNMSYVWSMHRAIRRELSPQRMKGWRDGLKHIQLLVANERFIRCSMKTPDVCILDECGSYHALLRLSLRSTNPENVAWNSILRNEWFTKSQPDVLVICDLNEDERIKRRATRGMHHDQLLMQDPSRKDFFDRNWKCAWPAIKRAAHVAHDSGKLTLTTVDMSLPIESNVDHLSRVVLGLR